MKNDDFEQLVTAVVDGTADVHTILKVADVMANDPEARTLFENVRRGARALQDLGLEEMPADLCDQIHRAVVDAAPRRRRQKEWRGFLVRPALRLVAPFAAGAIAGALILSLVTGAWRAPGGHGLAVEGAMQPRSGAAVDLGGAQASLVRSTSRALVFLDVSAPGVSRAEVSFDPDEFEASSVRWVRGPTGAVRADGERLALVLHGRGLCEVGLRALTETPALITVTWTGGSGSRQATLSTAQ